MTRDFDFWTAPCISDSDQMGCYVHQSYWPFGTHRCEAWQLHDFEASQAHLRSVHPEWKPNDSKENR